MTSFLGRGPRERGEEEKEETKERNERGRRKDKSALRTGRQMPSHVFSSRHVPGAEGERVEKFSCRLGGAVAAKNCPTIQDSAGNRCEPRFHASEG